MKHPIEQLWSDYVRGTADRETSSTLNEHLGSGCKRCAGHVKALEAVIRAAEADRSLEVPAHAMRSVHNMFRVQQLLAKQEATPSFSFKLAFDNALQPATVGSRSGVSQERHLVYESPEMTLDLQFKADAKSSGVRLFGQVLDSKAAPIADVPAFLVQDGRISSQDLSGRMGDFKLLGSTSNAPRLCLLLEDQQLINLELPPLGEDIN